MAHLHYQEEADPVVVVDTHATPPEEREWTEYLDDDTQRRLEPWFQCYVFSRRSIGWAIRVFGGREPAGGCDSERERRALTVLKTTNNAKAEHAALSHRTS